MVFKVLFFFGLKKQKVEFFVFMVFRFLIFSYKFCAQTIIFIIILFSISIGFPPLSLVLQFCVVFCVFSPFLNVIYVFFLRAYDA